MTVMKAIAAALLLATGIALVAAAQSAADFPSRPAKLLVPFAARGPTAVVARLLSRLLSARWGGGGEGDRAGRRPQPGARAPRKGPRCRQHDARPHNFFVNKSAQRKKAPLRHGEGFRAGQQGPPPAGRARPKKVFSRRYHSGI